MSQTWVMVMGSVLSWYVALGSAPPAVALAAFPNISSMLNLSPAVSAPKNFTCPQDIQSLTNLMLRDLPGYANRVMQRSIRLNSGGLSSYVFVAGNPDFNPINTDLSPQLGNRTQSNQNNQSNQSDTATQRLNDRQLQQVFFTTLNREYQGGRILEVQEFHRLFLVQTSQGWQLALMYSRSSIGSPSLQTLTPVRESLNSAVGQAVSTWLRDCQAGTLRSL